MCQRRTEGRVGREVGVGGEGDSSLKYIIGIVLAGSSWVLFLEDGSIIHLCESVLSREPELQDEIYEGNSISLSNIDLCDVYDQHCKTEPKMFIFLCLL